MTPGSRPSARLSAMANAWALTKVGEAFRNLLAHEVAKAQDLFQQGRTLPERVTGRLRWELRVTWRGGVCILDKIKAANYDVFQHRPVVSKWDAFRLIFQERL